jgi:hypothetical protein
MNLILEKVEDPTVHCLNFGCSSKSLSEPRDWPEGQVQHLKTTPTKWSQSSHVLLCAIQLWKRWEAFYDNSPPSGAHLPDPLKKVYVSKADSDVVFD